MNELLAAFRQESTELLEGMETAILALENGDSKALDALFRQVHTLKGSAGILGFGRLEHFTHELENRLGLIRSGAVAPNNETFNALLSYRDRCIRIVASSQDLAQKGDLPTAHPLPDDEDSLYLSALDGTLGAVEGSVAGMDAMHGSVSGAMQMQSGTGYIELKPRTSRASAPGDDAGATQRITDRKTVRIIDTKLDSLVNLVGELVTVQAQLTQVAAELGESRVLGLAEQVRRLVSELRGTSMEMRMVPAGLLFGRFKRVVRDLGSELGKQIDFRVEGAETELDKSLVESLYEPLLHLVRNAVDHGLEPPEQREASGKRRNGRITLSAAHTGASVTIEIRDDGSGIDDEAVRERAIAAGLLTPDARLSPDELRALIFEPGFSTAGKVSSLSGRGFGLDVVKTAVERLGGELYVLSDPGKGSTFTLEIPLTIAIIDGFLVRLGDRRFIIPLLCIAECFERPRSEARERLINRNGELVPVIDLRKHFTLTGTTNTGGREEIVIANVLDGKIALVLDQLLGGYQTVIKPLGELARFCPGVSGSAILADGQVALILDMPSLARTIRDQH
ncbi:MAG: chemotaxis protein CheA [Clostridia bacterium]|jgi:two-component system chemotaxis sensor kinase CheA